MTPHVKWWTTAKHETHGEFCLDDFEANHFYGEPPYYLTGPHAHKIKYLCGYVDIGGGAASESPTVARCPTCLVLASQAKIEGNRMVAEYATRVAEIARVAYELANPSISLEQRERAELARLQQKYK